MQEVIVRPAPIKQCPLTNLDLAYDFRINPNGYTHNLSYGVNFYGVEKNIRICCPFPGFRLNIRDNEIYRNEVKDEIDKQYFLHFLFEASKLEFEPLFKNVLHFTCDRNDEEGHLSIKPFIDNLFSELPPIPNREQKKKMLLGTIYDERGIDDFSEISFVNDFKFRAKSYMRDSKELNSYLEVLEEQNLIKILENKCIKFTEKGLEYAENGFKFMTNKNNNSINGNNNTVIHNVGDNANLNLTQNIGNTFSQENKNDIKEIIQFLKENKKELNLPNHTNTDIQILEDEINNETPNKGRINFALDSIKSGLISVGANLATPKVQEGLAMVVEIIKGAA